jgi:hypothetical protein
VHAHQDVAVFERVGPTVAAELAEYHAGSRMQMALAQRGTGIELSEVVLEPFRSGEALSHPGYETFRVLFDEDEVECAFAYRAHLIPDEVADRAMLTFARVLERGVADPDVHLSALAGDDERKPR